jgi:hypothetical protein
MSTTGPDALARRRRSNLVVAGIILFAVAFVALATWLGQYMRHRYAQEFVDTRTEDARRVAEFLDIHSTLLPETIPLPGAERIEAAAGELASKDGEAAETDRALLLLILQRPAEAAMVFRNPPRGPRGLLVLAIAKDRAHAPAAEVRAAYEAVLARDEDQPEALVRLSAIELESGSLEAAEQHAELAVRAAPGWHASHRALARVCLRREDTGRAKHAYRMVLALLPGDREADQAIRRIDGS